MAGHRQFTAPNGAAPHRAEGAGSAPRRSRGRAPREARPRTAPKARPAIAALTILIVTLLSAGALAQKPQEIPDLSAVARLSQEEFRKLHASGAVLVVDVRDNVAFSVGRIPGAIHVPVAEMDRRAADVIKQAKARAIVTYCSCPSEHSSVEAGWFLMKHGARDVRALVGGYIEWARNGGTIER